MHPAIKSITFTPGVEHDAVIEWPNGLGETPCSSAYLAMKEEADSILPPGESMDGLSPADYQRWNVLTDRLAGMQAEGHTGKAVRY